MIWFSDFSLYSSLFWDRDSTVLTRNKQQPKPDQYLVEGREECVVQFSCVRLPRETFVPRKGFLPQKWDSRPRLGMRTKQFGMNLKQQKRKQFIYTIFKRKS